MDLFPMTIDLPFWVAIHAAFLLGIVFGLVLGLWVIPALVDASSKNRRRRDGQ
jgi:uncharacterized integral membrane protein